MGTDAPKYKCLSYDHFLMSRNITRRNFLQVSSTSGIATVIAGCSGNERRPASQEPDQEPESEPASQEPETNFKFSYLKGLATESHLDTENKERINREYTAYSDGGETEYTESFSEFIYNFYHRQSRQYVNNYQFKYGSYVSDQLDKYIIDSIVSEFEEYGKKNNQTEREIIEHMMSFVQNLKYTTDKRGTGWNEYPKYPVETLVEQEGDCEDTSILMADLLRRYGYGTKLISATSEMTDGDTGGHMAVGIKGDEDVWGTYYTDSKGDRYYFIETTSSGTGIGEAPHWMNKARLRPVGIHPVPGAVYAQVTGVSNGQISVLGETVNTGLAGSENVQIRVSLIDSNRNIIDQDITNYRSVSGFQGDIENLGEAHQVREEISLNVSNTTEMRLVAESLVRGAEVSQTESKLVYP